VETDVETQSPTLEAAVKLEADSSLANEQTDEQGSSNASSSASTSLSSNCSSVTAAGKQKSYPCGQCGKVFNAHYNLTRHMPVHTGVRPFVCKVIIYFCNTLSIHCLL
jgi:uncharacterized Zn-finger protein